MSKQRFAGIPRYCGDVKIAVKLVPAPGKPHGEQYRCVLSVKGKVQGAQYVGIPRSINTAIDSPAAYDNAAHAAVTFAVDDNMIDGDACEFDHSGYRIRRVRRR